MRMGALRARPLAASRSGGDGSKGLATSRRSSSSSETTDAVGAAGRTCEPGGATSARRGSGSALPRRLRDRPELDEPWERPLSGGTAGRDGWRLGSCGCRGGGAELPGALMAPDRDRSVPPLRTGQGADAGGSRARHEAIS